VGRVYPFFSGFMKIRRDPKAVEVIHETVGVPMAYLPLLVVSENPLNLALSAIERILLDPVESTAHQKEPVPIEQTQVGVDFVPGDLSVENQPLRGRSLV
jgi:hypothetical protein